MVYEHEAVVGPVVETKVTWPAVGVCGLESCAGVAVTAVPH